MEKKNPKESIEMPWAEELMDVLEDLGVDLEQGLDTEEARRRRERYGANRLRQAETQSTWAILLEQFKSLIVLLLAAAAILSYAFGDWIEGTAIAIVILINAAIGFVTELRAVRSMEALQELTRVSSKVRRNGTVEEIPAEDLVPGDVLILAGGDVVTADARLIEASKLRANESTLTGESVPVDKQIDSIEEEAPLAERSNMVFKGTAITRGAGEAIVTATGMETELGNISSLVEEAEEEATPLQKRLDQLGQRLIWVTLGIAVVVALAGIIAGRELILMVETAIALAVASIPEGLPIVATVALARGMMRMAKRNALINKLSAVETLGAADVILTDKTGTLTENQMTAVEIQLAAGEVEIGGEGLELEGEFVQEGNTLDPQANDSLRAALRAGILCNNATVHQNEGENDAVGDPSEVALLVAGAKAGMRRDDLLEKTPEQREVAFDPQTKMMATFHRRDEGYEIAVKGAPGAVLAVSSHILTEEGETALDDETREEWRARNQHMAEDGLRVLALATRTAETSDIDPYEGLTFLGLVGLLDPPREEVRESIVACREAGIDVVMITGDQPLTARKVARVVGLMEGDEGDVIHGGDLGDLDDLSQEEQECILAAPVFARVSPEQKLDLIALHQAGGSIVAMTGDGVNDAPALKKADIGVAMGQRGTQVAREAADMVLKDDAFSTIVAAIEQGRVIFGNIRSFVLYLLSCNISEVMVVGLASLINAPLPIRPLQILFLNLVTDVFPALALGMGEGDPVVMDRPPRNPDEPVMTRKHWRAMAGYGALITASVLGSLGLALRWLGMGQEQAVTISFLTLAFAQLWHVFNMRDKGTSLLRNDITENAYVWGALALCVMLLLGAVYVPGVSDVLRVVDPGLTGWGMIIGMSLVPLGVGQIWKQVVRT